MDGKELTGYPSIDRIHLRGIPEEVLHPEIYPLSMLATFQKINEGHMDEIAIDTIERQYTKQEILDKVSALAAAMLGLGLMAGDKVALIVPNCVEGILIVLAANALGISIAMLDPYVPPEQTFDEIALHKPDVVFVKDKPPREVAQILPRHAEYVNFVIDLDRAQVVDVDGWMSFDAFLAEAAYASPEVVQGEIQRNAMNEEVKFYLQTSGSTSGRPKTLPFGNRASFASLIYASNSTGTKTRDARVNRVLCVAPYQHGYGWLTIFVNLMGGNQVILAPGATEDDIAEYYKYDASYIYGSPLIFRCFMDRTPAEADLSSLTAFFCAGFSISEEWFEEGERFFAAHNSHAEIRNNYGISEGLGIGTASDGVPHRPGTCGKFYVGPEFVLVDDELNEVKYGETGELIVAAETLCDGYYGEPELTRESFIERDGKIFYRSGDYLSLSTDGYVSFVGRKKRFYQPRGVADKVNCETIEQAILAATVVEQAAVVVTKDKDGIEGARAFVVLDEEVQDPVTMVNSIFGSLSERLREYQMPREITLLDKMPLLNSGKIDYPKLEALGTSE